MAECILCGAAAGVGAQQMWDLIKGVASLRSNFKRQYKRVGKQLEMLGYALDGGPSDLDVEDLRSEIKRGEELISKCTKASFFKLVFKHSRYSEQVENLDEAIERHWRTLLARRLGELKTEIGEVKSRLDDMPALPPLPEKVLGVEEPLRELKGLLRRHQVVGICGIGGCGKTTLANKLCRDPDIEDEYGERIFLAISSSSELVTICQRLYKKLHKSDGPSANEASVNEGTKKSLIVLDDVRSPEGDIRVLVDAMKRTARFKILITSRIELDICDETYPVEGSLHAEDARKLFTHHASPPGGRSWNPNEQLIDEIVRGCKFHPLALVVIGSYLAKEDERVWKHTAKRLQQTGEILKGTHGEEIIGCLSTSLTSLLKEGRECFLDLVCFPEYETIPATAIIDMWTETRDVFDEDGAYVILRELERRNLVKLVDRKCGGAGDKDGSFSSLSVCQHELIRELTIHEIKKEGDGQVTRLFMEERKDNIPDTWVRENGRTSQAKLVSINTGDMKSSDWPDLNLPNAEVLILNFSATSYCLPNFLKRMKNLKVLVIANHGPKRAELDGLHLLSSLHKLKRAMFRKISLPAEPLRAVETGGFHLPSRVRKFVNGAISLKAHASTEPPQELHKLSLVLCDVRHLLRIPSLFSRVRNLEMDYCTDLDKLPDTICDISNMEKLSITNSPDLLNLPDGIGKLRKLEVLRLHACGKLEGLPHSLSQLSELRFLDISYCSALDAFPEGMENLGCLKKIDMRSCLSIKELPSSMVQLKQHLERVVCDEDGEYLWKPYRLDESQLHVYKEEVTLAFLYG